MKLKNIFKLFLLILFLSSCSATKKVNSDISKNTKSKITKHQLKSKNNSIEDFANYIGVKKKELKNKDLYVYIDNWLGIPHKLGGTSKKGIDCSAFVKDIYDQVYQINLPRTSREMSEVINTKKTDKLTEGDLIFFSFSGQKIDHVGIYLQNNKFVHVSTKKGVIISNLDDIWYKKYVTKAGSFKN